MGGLFGGGTISTEAEKLATIRIQTSAYGRVIPVVYGTARIAGNLLWSGGRRTSCAPPTRRNRSRAASSGSAPSRRRTRPTPTPKRSRSGSAKGRSPASGTSGPRRRMDHWLNVAAKLGLTLFVGNAPQAVWSWLTSNHPAEAVPYDGIAFVAMPDVAARRERLAPEHELGGWRLLPGRRRQRRRERRGYRE
jgi:hypothetical protein